MHDPPDAIIVYYPGHRIQNDLYTGETMLAHRSNYGDDAHRHRGG
jgi:hypothetical protein